MILGEYLGLSDFWVLLLHKNLNSRHPLCMFCYSAFSIEANFTMALSLLFENPHSSKKLLIHAFYSSRFVCLLSFLVSISLVILTEKSYELNFLWGILLLIKFSAVYKLAAYMFSFWTYLSLGSRLPAF